MLSLLSISCSRVSILSEYSIDVFIKHRLLISFHTCRLATKLQLTNKLYFPYFCGFQKKKKIKKNRVFIFQLLQILVTQGTRFQNFHGGGGAY